MQSAIDNVCLELLSHAQALARNELKRLARLTIKVYNAHSSYLSQIKGKS